MLAEGQHAGIEVSLSTLQRKVTKVQARIVRMENGNFEGRGDPFCTMAFGACLEELTIKRNIKSSMVLAVKTARMS